MLGWAKNHGIQRDASKSVISYSQSINQTILLKDESERESGEPILKVEWMNE